jgi:glycosyltransferase involved in cell wall biosynthesis
MSEEMRLTIIIPAFNEEMTIRSVLERILRCVPTVFEVIVVDDGSTDGTADQCKEHLRRDERVRLLQHPTNKGKTAALRTGLLESRGDIIVVQDADLEYDPGEIPALIEPIVDGKGDVCLGSRFLVRKAGRVLYFRHYVANKLITFLSNICTDLNLTDVETGYKAARSGILKQMIIESSGFGFEIEFVAKCQKLRARIYEIPISYYGRTYNEGKKIGFKDGLHALWYILKFNLFRSTARSFKVIPEFHVDAVSKQQPTNKSLLHGAGH